MALVEAPHIAAPHGLHHQRQRFALLRRGQQVEMVVHQHVGMHCHTEFLGRFGQQRQHGFKVLPVCEDGLAVVSALDDVVRVTRQRQAGQAGHGQR